MKTTKRPRGLLPPPTVRAGLPSGLLLVVGLLSGCFPPDGRRPLGDSCEESDACGSGLCYENRCVDPEGDDDDDGLVNRVEVAFGSNLAAADTDGDGARDGDELGDFSAPRDTDGDGALDLVESSIEDGDTDCIADQTDARDGTANGRDSGLVDAACGSRGVCGSPEAAAALTVRCDDGLGKPACDASGVPGYEAEETSCDGLDNDCDGEADAHCDPLLRNLVAHWELNGNGRDSGFFKMDGRIFGASGAPDRFGNPDGAVRFNGATDRIEVSAAGHPLGEATVTYSVWVRPDLEPEPWRANHGALFAWGAVSSPREASALVLRPGLGCASYIGGTNPVLASRTCAPAGHWSHIVVVKTGASVKMYFDGRLRDTGETGGGQQLGATRLVIGAARDVAQSAPQLPFKGVLDDLQVWSRALEESEILALYREGQWPDAGTEARPAAQCLHARDGVEAAVSGLTPVDLDGDGPQAPRTVWCDQETDGGGWALAWRYGFTAAGAFRDPTNAVTPAPELSRGAASGGTTPEPDAQGALPIADWKWLGREIRVASDLTRDVACLPGAGSVSDLASGSVRCRALESEDFGCPAAVPTRFVVRDGTPTLEGAAGAFVRWDLREDADWPAHDPCGRGQANHRADAVDAGGALWLRPTRDPVLWARDCEGLEAVARTSGSHQVDPDGRGGAGPLFAECDFETERGGWTLLEADVAAGLAAVAGPREYLFKRDRVFIRSPMTTVPWDDAAYAEVTGLWHLETDGARAFTCAGGGVGGESGLGCADAAFQLVPDGAVEGGLVSICGGPDTRPLGDNCVEDVAVYVRLAACQVADGALTGDPGFDAIGSQSEGGCWAATGPGGWFGGFSLDRTIIADGAVPPALKASNVAGSEAYGLQLSQRRLSVVGGRGYRIRFKARAEAPRTVRVVLRSRTSLYLAHSEEVTVGDAWQDVALTFEAPETAWDAQVDLQFGGLSSAPVWVDDVRVEDAGEAACVAADPVENNGNVLMNGDFTRSGACWKVVQTAGAAGGWVLSVAAADGEALLTPLGSPAAGDVSLTAPVGVLSPGAPWRVTLEVRAVDVASGGGALTVSLREAASGRLMGRAEPVSPGADWQTVTFLTALEAGARAELVVTHGDARGGIALRDVRVEAAPVR